ncbi:hypothetical protein SETIT_9G572800v2 [Setaria italica]|uniref:Myb-like domain-containing protein n=1 Tax=Setaria italica TaxID=4555 RepID=A0A368SX42_SETIT|nr:uncharacterized protein LOC101777183 [Setaria italica]RCV46954.1 hypothetical protein SETIT_9G572800v2 [Setaria italica]
MEEGGFDYWNWSVPLATPRGPEAADGSSLPPPLSSDGWARSNSPRQVASPPLIITADRSWSLDDIEDLSMLGDDILPAGTNGSLALEAADWSLFGPQSIHGDDGLSDQAGGAGEESQDPLLEFDSLDSLLDLDGSSSGSGANQASVDSQLQAAGADHPWGMDSWLPMAPPAVSNTLLLEQTQVGAGDSPPAAPATGPNQAGIDEMSAVLPEDETADVTMTLADMIRIAEECGKDEAASRMWSEEEHKDLLYGLRRYAKHNRVHSCFNISTYLNKKTALDVALRCRWLQDKEKTAKQAELVQKDSAGIVKVNKGQGTKGAKKSKNMYPLSKEALDSKSNRELLRDSYIFMQQIEENIKTGKFGEETADYFYFVRTNMDAIGKRENEFCRISMPLPPIDEQGLEEILQQSGHSSSVTPDICCLCYWSNAVAFLLS